MDTYHAARYHPIRENLNFTPSSMTTRHITILPAQTWMLDRWGLVQVPVKYRTIRIFLVFVRIEYRIVHSCGGLWKECELSILVDVE